VTRIIGGVVTDLRVNKSTATEAETECALEMTRGATFEPETLNGTPIGTRIVQYFNFVRGEPNYSMQATAGDGSVTSPSRGRSPAAPDAGR
jgi:hypothetical protein